MDCGKHLFSLHYRSNSTTFPKPICHRHWRSAQGWQNIGLCLFIFQRWSLPCAIFLTWCTQRDWDSHLLLGVEIFTRDSSRSVLFFWCNIFLRFYNFVLGMKVSYKKNNNMSWEQAKNIAATTTNYKTISEQLLTVKTQIIFTRLPSPSKIIVVFFDE